MSRASPDDQLKFLLSCVRHANNGKIDFVEVAKDCNIVSKGAAAKRYERLMKANGIHPNGAVSDKPAVCSSNGEHKLRTIYHEKSAFAKRRKMNTNQAAITKTNRHSKHSVSASGLTSTVTTKPEMLGTLLPHIYPPAMNSQMPQCVPQQFASAMPNYASNYSLYGQYPQPTPTQNLPVVPRYMPAHPSAYLQDFNSGYAPIQAQTQPQTQVPSRVSNPELEATNLKAIGEPFVLDDKANALFDNFCESEIFATGNMQNSSVNEKNVVDAGVVAITETPNLCPTSIKTEPGAVSDCILIVD